MCYRLRTLLIVAVALGTAIASGALLALGNVWISLVFVTSLVLVLSLVLHELLALVTSMMEQGQVKSDKASTPRQQTSLLDQLVAIPSARSIVLAILITAVIAAIIFSNIRINM